MLEWKISASGAATPVNNFALHSNAFGPFVFAKPGGVKQVQTARGSLVAFNCDARHFVTCADLNGSIIYTIDQVCATAQPTPFR